jgi:DNA-binding MarR family transcriptional regulator
MILLLDNGSKFYSKSYTFIVHILEMVREHYTQSQIANTLGISKSHVSYYVNKTIVLGYINEICRDRIRILELTQKGTNFLDQYENNYNNQTSSRQLPMCRAENLRFKAKVFRLPRIQLDWNRIEMNNWTQYNSIVDDIRVHINDGKVPSIEFIPSPIDGNNPWELFGILFNDCNEVARRLEQTLDMDIGRLEIEHGAEWAIYNDPVAKLISKFNGQISVEGLGKINASKPLRRGEIEFFDPMFAVDYISMPKRISNIEKLLEELLKREKEYNHANIEDLIDKEQEIEHIAEAAEQPEDKDRVSGEES